MSDKVFNKHQQTAIDARDKSIVVSAAAGSGKTSVLTERVLRLVEQGEDIERMLIVTFTNLAASEMKERIYQRLSSAGRQTNSARLAAQAEKCVFSDISTIHVFCNNIIRDNFEYAGVSPTFSLASDAETALLKQRALDHAVESYSSEVTDFLLRYAPRGNTNGIKSIVSKIYSRIISSDNPTQWLSNAQSNFSGTQIIDSLFAHYKSMAHSAAATASDYLSARSAVWEEKGFVDEADASEAERIQMLRAIQSISPDNTTLPILPPIEKFKGAPYGIVSKLTNKANKCFEELTEYSVDFAQKISDEQLGAGSDGGAFIEITRAFVKQYTKLKREKNILDHDDSLHLAKKVLSEDAIAQRYKNRYTHVFVDEYQDINNVQHAIISRVKRDDNDFFVGDVKQCIYMFRESNPDLLIARCSELKGSGLIEMNTNYRSCPAIIDFINGVMQNMMTEQIGGVAYAGGHMLSAGISGSGDVKVSLPISDSATAAESRAIAAHIRDLVAQGFEYKDIAILRPVVAGDGRQIAKALTDLGIPLISGFNSTDPDFSDVSVYLNLLKVIDGSYDDVALLSVMRYPYFGFTEPEFAKIRIHADANTSQIYLSFSDAVRMFTQRSALGEKVQRFSDKIAYFSLLSDSLTMPDFLMRLRQEVMFREYALTAPSGKDKELAISALIDNASMATHISGILEISDRIIAAQNAGSAQNDTNAVFFTTIHKSKGLEFPAVILSGMHKRINQQDTQSSVLVGRSLGLALDISDTASHIKRPTLHKKAVASAMREEKICETVRLLYVGMTRAQQKLIICGVIKKHKEEWEEPKAANWQLSAGTHLDLIMPALHMYADDISQFVDYSDFEVTALPPHNKAEKLTTLFEKAALAQPIDIRDAYRPDTRIPSKLSVSALKRMGESRDFTPAYLPSESTEISASERGTLTHKVLQKIGLDQRNAAQVSSFVTSLAQSGIIDAKHTEHVDAQSIARFLNSDIATRARHSERSLPEAPFCLQMPAKQAGLTDSDEPIIVQGVIDLCFIENDNWVIVDYKTDSVTVATCADAAQKYAVQLSLYANALTGITKLPVKEKVIFFLAPGKSVSLV
ncbi:MAG: UvrD-helicase domain-containing protein [Clostridia bacterium]|jgi:ATP-dependent helicase/nuclease subunit A|nr:UvrD-helicase domain-containing protein [Clostridia bacterium]MBT7123239.1 UvrD-helicase domain-containing protein [Clostridia bacterium]